MAQQIMPNAKAYSPRTTLNGGITSGATQITVTDVTVFPAAPFLAVITGADNPNFSSWDPADYETVLVEEIDGSTLKQVTRGVEGTAQAWANGSYIACVFTAEAYKRLKENIEDHLSEYAQPHMYEDEGEDPDWTGIKYRLVVVDGEAYLEVVEVPE